MGSASNDQREGETDFPGWVPKFESHSSGRRNLMQGEPEQTESLDRERVQAIYQPGADPALDAWYTAFLIENHLDHLTHPDHAAPPEQLRFMVYVEEDERYYPCSDRMFAAIMGREHSILLQNGYSEAFERVMALVRTQIEDPDERKFLEALIRYKHRHETRDAIMIPSRLQKRLLLIFTNRTRIDDPFREDKQLRNRRAKAALDSQPLKSAVDAIEASDLPEAPASVTRFKRLVEHLEVRRLLALTGNRHLWVKNTAAQCSEADFRRMCTRRLTGNGVSPFFAFLNLPLNGQAPASYTPKKILWLANEAGEFVFDMAVIRCLARMGHKVIIAFKDGPLFTKITCDDIREDPVLRKHMEGILLVTDKDLTKNDLVKTLRSDYHTYGLSDGTRENINLLLASTTFARAFKEVDAVVSRGLDQRQRFFATHFQFTQDIYNIAAHEDGQVSVRFKPRHPAVIKFTHQDLERKALAIIEQMRRAKEQGMTVIFYSGIIGSIPGKIKTAKKIMSVFIGHLQKQSAMTFIINPSEYYEPGMDADDLMYMWEIVQRSGLIDIWRFQTNEDVVQAFQIMKMKTPPEWVGKDATYSTGCTKEMRIALEVIRKHPEMQIIGPAREKFIRRAEYGIGQMFDKRLVELLRAQE
jgi:hypothetical protein